MPDNSETLDLIRGAIEAPLGMNPILGNIIAGWKSSRASRAKEGLINDYSADTTAKYNNLVNRDYMDSNMASSVMTRIKDQLKNANSMADKQQATTGATNEATLAAKTANQGTFNNAVGQIAAMGTAREDQLLGQQQNAENTILGLKVGLQNDKIAAAQTQQANNNATMQSMLDIGSMAAGGGVGLLASKEANFGGKFVDSTSTTVIPTATNTAPAYTSDPVATTNQNNELDPFWAMQFLHV